MSGDVKVHEQHGDVVLSLQCWGMTARYSPALFTQRLISSRWSFFLIPGPISREAQRQLTKHAYFCFQKLLRFATVTQTLSFLVARETQQETTCTQLPTGAKPGLPEMPTPVWGILS